MVSYQTYRLYLPAFADFVERQSRERALTRLPAPCCNIADRAALIESAASALLERLLGRRGTLQHVCGW